MEWSIQFHERVLHPFSRDWRVCTETQVMSHLGQVALEPEVYAVS